MKLELTRRNLRRVEELDNPAVEDVLNFIYDFCQDVKNESGYAVDKLPCREEDAMYKRLPWLGRTVSKIGAEQSGILTEDSRRQRIAELDEKLQKLDQQISDAGVLREELHGKRAFFRQKEEALREEKRGVLELQSRIREAEQRLAELEQMDSEDYSHRLEEVREQLGAREKEIARTEEKRKQLADELADRTRRLEESRDQINLLNQQIRETEARLVDQQKERETGRGILDQGLERMDVLQREIRALEEKKAQQDASVEEMMKTRNALQIELESEEGKLRLRALESRRREIDRIEEELRKIRGLRELLLREWNSPWAVESRMLEGKAAATEVPGEILQTDLDAMQKKLSQYRDDLRMIVLQMSSPEYRV